MPSMQTTFFTGASGTTSGRAPTAERLFGHPHAIKWCATDWSEPVGYLYERQVASKESVVSGVVVGWCEVRVPALFLSHRAALWLLQGASLQSILLPNYLQLQDTTETAGDILLRVDPWKYWRSTPVLTGLVLAQVRQLPANLPVDEVLSAFVAETAS